ncbi:uncharacterized protein LOC130429510 [Triplophysa dalaica]|uniref:uncharacterized protein LOC130429510 n=1 Tax=Triplophysa dalaica TaxID=1582913 RepID=UPI0024DF747F|nr:uncharacterized protein LOC130429510 [Triplophysa dalaica]
MGICLILLCVSLLIARGVFGDEVKSVSVMEGHFVILDTHVLKQRNDLMVWTYGPENTFIARLNGKANSIMYSDDERFTDRVKLEDQTGSLVIDETTTNLSGLYKLKISRNKNVSNKRFNVTVYDDVKSVSVREGHSVILYTHVLKKGHDLMVWTYGPENTLVATIDVQANSTMYSDDERFRDRVKMNNQTGDLIITHITSQHSGLYTLNISSNNKVSYKRFSVIIYGDVKSLLVREGHSVILYTHVLKQSHDLMVWTYGPEKTFVARLNELTGITRLSDDERFRDRVNMDDQTGALVINETTTHHSGLYTLNIINNHKVSNKSFNLTVVTTVHDSRVQGLCAIPFALLMICIICICVRVRKQRANITTSDR